MGEGRPRVLVADDEPAMRLLLRVNLDIAGFDVVEVPDGSAALRELEAGEFDVAVLDVMMPELTGHDVARALRGDRPRPAPPFVFLSARASEEDQRLGFELGAVEYVVKPFDALAIGDVLRTALERVAHGTAESYRRERLAALSHGAA